MILLSLNNSPPEVIGTVSGTNENVPWVATLTADRGSPNAPSARYTMLILPDTNSAPGTSPGGAGFASITNYAGATKDPASACATIAGTLADGTAFNEVVPVSQNGNIPIFASLYGNKGLLMGWINLNPDSQPGTGLVWVHPRPGAGLIRNSFTATNLVALSPWTNPPSASTLAAMTNLAILGLFNDPATDRSNFDVAISGKFNVSKRSGSGSVSGSLNPKTGLLTVNIGSGTKELTGRGVILLNATNGGGFVLTKTNAEAIQLGP